MFQRKPRRFRRRQNDRNQISRGVNNNQVRLRSNSFSNGHSRNNFRPSLSPEKLFEKYTSLAKEAISSGDKTLSENYLQHADHFMRVIEDRNKNRNQNKINVVDKTIQNEKNPSVNIDNDSTSKK
tara:strand:- start:130 stop:504 length:375 start_codon:yes stop_codon:yes gene_type:complete